MIEFHGTRITVTRNSFGYLGCDLHGVCAGESIVYSCSLPNYDNLGVTLHENAPQALRNTGLAAAILDFVRCEVNGLARYLELSKPDFTATTTVDVGIKMHLAISMNGDNLSMARISG